MDERTRRLRELLAKWRKFLDDGPGYAAMAGYDTSSRALELCADELAAVLDTDGDRMKIPSDNEVVDFLVAYHGYQNRATFVASLTDDRFNEVRLIQAWATLTRADTEGDASPAPRPARYDLVTNYRCGDAIEEMERADDGEWVRYEDVFPDPPVQP